VWCKVGGKKDVLTVEESTFMLEIETEKISECDNFLSLFIRYILQQCILKIEKVWVFFSKK